MTTFKLYFCDKLDEYTYPKGGWSRPSHYYDKVHCDELPNITFEIDLFDPAKPFSNIFDPVKYILNNSIVKEKLNHLGNEDLENKISIHIIEKNPFGSNSRGEYNIITYPRIPNIDKIDYFRINYPPPELSPLQHNTKYNDNSPIILLDVDGVINCFGYGYGDSMTTDKNIKVLAYAGNKMVGINYNQSVVDKINKLSETCKIYWATSWKHTARYRLAPLIGLNDFEVCSYIDKNLIEWDFPMHYLNGRKVIWIDDQLGYYLKSEREAKGVDIVSSILEKNLLLIIPESNKGLQDSHFQKIDDFISLSS